MFKHVASNQRSLRSLCLWFNWINACCRYSDILWDGSSGKSLEFRRENRFQSAHTAPLSISNSGRFKRMTWRKEFAGKSNWLPVINALWWKHIFVLRNLSVVLIEDSRECFPIGISEDFPKIFYQLINLQINQNVLAWLSNEIMDVSVRKWFRVNEAFNMHLMVKKKTLTRPYLRYLKMLLVLH